MVCLGDDIFITFESSTRNPARDKLGNKFSAARKRKCHGSSYGLERSTGQPGRDESPN
jgi:hypothetical protein